MPDDEESKVMLPAPEGDPAPQHGAQVRLTGLAHDAARGAARGTMLGNIAVKAAVEGGVHDGGAADMQHKLDPADGTEMEERIKSREAEAVVEEKSAEE